MTLPEKTVRLVVQLNADWKLLHVEPESGTRKMPYWHLSKEGDDRAGAIFAVKHSVVEWVKYRCGPIAAEAQAIVDALPEKCVRAPREPAPRPPRVYVRPTVHRNCRRCGTVFVLANNGIRFFCGRSCKDAYHGEQRTLRKAARKAAQPPRPKPAPKPRPIENNAPSSEIPAGAMTPEDELTETMRADQLEARLELIRATAAKVRQNLPERISAVKPSQPGRWAR
jgi:hypothetical protein